MTHSTRSFVQIEREFQALGVDTTLPGFYDHPAFLEAERVDPAYLQNYAKFVHRRPLDEQYVKRVERVAPVVASGFKQALVENGRLGACVDISILVSRALEQEGVWNYLLKGSLTIRFPRDSGIEPKYFWSVDSGDFAAAHAWVVAPPFFVIDISIQLQPYQGNEANYLPPIVVERAEELIQASREDIASPEIRHKLTERGIPTTNHLRESAPHFGPFNANFPARRIMVGETSLKYIPFEPTAPDAPFEDTVSMRFDGKTGFEVYRDRIRPKLSGQSDT